MGCSRHGGHPRTGLNSLDALPYIVVIGGLFLVVLYSGIKKPSINCHPRTDLATPLMLSFI